MFYHWWNWQYTASCGYHTRYWGDKVTGMNIIKYLRTSPKHFQLWGKEEGWMMAGHYRAELLRVHAREKELLNTLRKMSKWNNFMAERSTERASWKHMGFADACDTIHYHIKTRRSL